MLNLAGGRKLFFATICVLFFSFFVSELIIKFEIGHETGCNLIPVFSSVWPSLRQEADTLRGSSTILECSFVTAKTINISISLLFSLIAMGVISFNFRLRETLFQKSATPFIILMVLLLVSLLLFPNYPIISSRNFVDHSFKARNLVRASTMAPIIISTLLSIGFIGFCVKSTE